MGHAAADADRRRRDRRRTTSSLVGARNLDPPEVEFIAAAGIQDDAEAVLDRVDCVYVALDCDVFDPGELAVFMPEPGGPTVAEVETAALPRARRGEPSSARA